MCVYCGSAEDHDRSGEIRPYGDKRPADKPDPSQEKISSQFLVCYEMHL